MPVMAAMVALLMSAVVVAVVDTGIHHHGWTREQAIRYVMQSNLCDAVVIGCKSAAEIDEAIERVNRALAEG